MMCPPGSMAVHILVVATAIPRGGREYDRNARDVRQHVSVRTPLDQSMAHRCTGVLEEREHGWVREQPVEHGPCGHRPERPFAPISRVLDVAPVAGAGSPRGVAAEPGGEGLALGVRAVYPRLRHVQSAGSGRRAGREGWLPRCLLYTSPSPRDS